MTTTIRTLATLALLLAVSALPAAAQQSANEVLVGGAISQTGRYAEPAGRQVNSIKMWVDEVNARGGLLGRKVRLILLDDKSDTQTSIKLYEKLITEDKVDVILGPYSSGITEAVANVTERYKKPFVAYGAASSPIWEKGRRYIFNIVAVAEDYQKGAVHLAKQIGVKKAAIIGEDSLFPRQSGKGAKEWAKKLGIEIVVEENYPLKQTDFTALLQKIKAAGAEALFSNSYFADSAAQLRQMREQNINFKLYSSTIGPALPNYAEQLGATAEYVIGFSQWEPLPKILKNPGMEEYIAAYEKRYGEKPNYHAGSTYGALQVTEAAIKKAGSFDSEKLREALATLDIVTVYGHYKVDAKGMNAAEGLTFQILKGQRRVVYPDKWAETKPELPVPEWSKR
ncbi:MAG TPA: amino acid ABC transporter substrate-binding protein [Candidatus Acidoferrum sp.]|jgi:branched-chain amino acid transport system substrate-binding protein|nr:amino acid ABC transporter substrate-binding protein [Candidatus Acidoferrum sp.]